VQYQRDGLKVVGGKETYNNWKDLSQKDLLDGAASKMTAGDKEKASQAAQGAFDGVNFRDIGYRLLSEPKVENNSSQNSIAAQ